MAIRFIKQPASHAATTEEMLFDMHSDNTFAVPEVGIHYVGHLRFEPRKNIANGEALVFELAKLDATGQPMRIEMRAGIDFPLNSRAFGGPPEGDYTAPAALEVLASCARKNTLLNQFYDIAVQDRVFVLTAREAGPAFNLNSQRNARLRMQTAGAYAPAIARPHFKLLFELFFRKNESSDFKKILSSELIPLDGKASMEIAKTLEMALAPKRKPSSKISRASAGAYYCEVSEVYGTPPMVQHTLKTALNQVSLKGKLALLVQPAQLSFSGNPMIFKIQTEVDPARTGTYFVGYLDDRQLHRKAGAKLIFEIGDELVEFHVKPYLKSAEELGRILPSRDSNYQGHFLGDRRTYLPYNQEPEDPKERWDGDDEGNFWPLISLEKLLPFLKANYLLRSHFDISCEGDKLYFHAHQKGAASELCFMGSQSHANKVLHIEDAGTDEKLLDSQRLLVELFFRAGRENTFEKIYAEELNLDPSQSLLSLDVAPMLDAYLSQEVLAMEEPMRICKTSKGAYFLRYAEIVPGKNVQTCFESSIKQVIKGGLSRFAFEPNKLLRFLQPDEDDPSKDRFLKQGPRRIKLREDQPEGLYFINTRPETSELMLKIAVEYADGSSAAHFSEGTIVSAFDKVVFSVGMQVLGLQELHPQKSIQAYTCHLIDQEEKKVSESITCCLDEPQQTQARYFLYGSSFGTLDTLVAFGKASQAYELSSETIEKHEAGEQGRMATDRLTFGLKLNRTFKVSTGLLEPDQFDRLADFFLAEKKFLLQEDPSSREKTCLPITVTSKKLGQLDDYNPIPMQSFEYQYDFDEYRYTESMP